MRKILLFNLILLFAISIYAQPYTWTTKIAGPWSSANTWTIPSGVPGGQSFPETTDDDVVINHDVTLDVSANNLSVNSVSIDFNSGVARLNMGVNSLSTSGNFTTTGPGPGWSDLTMQGGTLDIGITNANAAFLVNNGLLSISAGSVINVGGYLKFIGGTLNFSDNVEVNVSRAGVRNDNTESNFFIGQNVTINGSDNVNIDFNIENGNNGTASEIYLEEFTRSTGANGNVTYTLKNLLGNTDYLFQTDIDFDQIVSDIGDNDSLLIQRISGFTTLMVNNITLNSGSYRLPLDLNLSVDNDFISNTNKDLRIDGELTVNAKLSLNGNPNNIIGDGIVQANTYSLGANTVYGVQPADGEKAAGGTWRGGTDINWFNGNNWGQPGKIPGKNTAVLIHSNYNLGNWPIVNSVGSTAEARSVELDGNGVKLSMDNDGQMNIQEVGSSGKGGDLIVGEDSDFILSGGTLTVETNINIESNATLSVNSSGTVNVNKDVNVNTGGALNINSGTFQIGQ